MIDPPHLQLGGVASDDGGSDGCIEVPQLEEIEESVRVKKPIKRSVFRSHKMMG